MSQTVSTYIHLPYEIRERLEHRAEKIQREVNWIIIEAIKEYLFKINSNFFIEEARRQSLSVSRHPEPSDDIWESNIDDSEWKE